MLWPPNIVVQEPRLDPISLPARLSTDDRGPRDLPDRPVDKVWFWQAKVNPDQIHAPRRLSPLELALLGLAALTLAMYDREIWFWLDRQLDRPTTRTAVQQLITTLAAGGLETHQGVFTDVPDRVDWPEQTGYRPAHEEGHGGQAMVAILTDGEGLARRLENPLSRPAAERLLRNLRRWPHLCFVDCMTTDARLEALLAPYGLETITLAELPRWLGGIEPRVETEVPRGADVYGDARVWAAAVALGGTQASTTSGHSLRVALRLNVSPWRVDQIMAEAQQPGARHRLINWLLRCDPLDEHGMPQPVSLAHQALDWWQQRYATGAQQMQAQENPPARLAGLAGQPALEGGTGVAAIVYRTRRCRAAVCTTSG